jgi:hypothetical protein
MSSSLHWLPSTNASGTRPVRPDRAVCSGCVSAKHRMALAARENPVRNVPGRCVSAREPHHIQPFGDFFCGQIAVSSHLFPPSFSGSLA